jgi:tetratricopeptide (TPR) repeat protein
MAKTFTTDKEMEQQALLEPHLVELGKTIAGLEPVLKQDPSLAAISLNNLGMAYNALGEHGLAQQYQLEAQELSYQIAAATPNSNKEEVGMIGQNPDLGSLS